MALTKQIILTADGKIFRRECMDVELDISAAMLESRLFGDNQYKAIPLGKDVILLSSGPSIGYARVYSSGRPLTLAGSAVNVLADGVVSLRPCLGTSNGLQGAQGIPSRLSFTPPPDCLIVLLCVVIPGASGVRSPVCFALSTTTGGTFFPGLPNVHQDGAVCLGSALSTWYSSQAVPRPLIGIENLMQEACNQWERAEFNRDLTEYLPASVWNQWLNFDPATGKNILPTVDWTTLMPPIMFGAGSDYDRIASALRLLLK
jgi:hypothetical protein